jgi:hypothetical protein
LLPNFGFLWSRLLWRCICWVFVEAQCYPSTGSSGALPHYLLLLCYTPTEHVQEDR